MGISKGGERLKQTSGMKWEEQRPLGWNFSVSLTFQSYSFFISKGIFFSHSTVGSQASWGCGHANDVSKGTGTIVGLFLSFLLSQHKHSSLPGQQSPRAAAVAKALQPWRDPSSSCIFCICSTVLGPSGSSFRFIWCYLLAL